MIRPDDSLVELSSALAWCIGYLEGIGHDVSDRLFIQAALLPPPKWITSMPVRSAERVAAVDAVIQAAFAVNADPDVSPTGTIRHLDQVLNQYVQVRESEAG